MYYDQLIIFQNACPINKTHPHDGKSKVPVEAKTKRGLSDTVYETGMQHKG